MKQDPSQIPFFEWSPHKSTRPLEKEVSQDDWALIGEVQSASSYSRRSLLDLNQEHRPRRRRCISEESASFSDTLHENNKCGEYSSLASASSNSSTSLDDSIELGQSESYYDGMFSFSESSTQQSRQKRRRDDCCENMSYESIEDSRLSCPEELPIENSRKRRRVSGKNKALCASDFDDIFSQIGC
jgi:hypothetical protein